MPSSGWLFAWRCASSSLHIIDSDSTALDSRPNSRPTARLYDCIKLMAAHLKRIETWYERHDAGECDPVHELQCNLLQ